MVARVGIPVIVLHRNELDDRLAAAVRDMRLPVVLAHRADGSIVVALTSDRLTEFGGSVDLFEQALRV